MKILIDVDMATRIIRKLPAGVDRLSLEQKVEECRNEQKQRLGSLTKKDGNPANVANCQAVETV